MHKFDFLYSRTTRRITNANIHDVYFLHGNKENTQPQFKLSPQSVTTEVVDYDGVPLSLGKMSGDILWASPYHPEFIDLGKYNKNKSENMEHFFETRKARTWKTGQSDTPIVALSDWDAFTQLESPCFTAQNCTFFKIAPSAKILIINTFSAYKAAMNKFGFDYLHVGFPNDIMTYFEEAPVLKFENIAKEYDGIYISSKLSDSSMLFSDEKKAIMRALSIWDVDSLVLWNNIMINIVEIDAHIARQKVKNHYLGMTQKAFTKGIQYETTLNNESMIIKESNLFKQENNGFLLGVQNDADNKPSIFYQKDKFCYKVTLSDFDTAETKKICCIKKWGNFLMKNPCVNTEYAGEIIKICQNATAFLKNKNQIVDYPATTFWIKNKLLAVFYSDIVGVSHAIINKI